MSIDFNAYQHSVTKHEELMAWAEIERQLRDAAPVRPCPVARLRVAVGRLLISAGESLTRAARAPGRA